MCGVAGTVRLDGAPANPEVVERMLSCLHHRGPDDQGLWRQGPVVLGHTRLSIIDVDGSHQPMVGADGSCLTYNGEVFNYRALRDTLPGPWSTRGDTEVVHRILSTQGVVGLRRVRGQFSLAVWSSAQQTLTLARDSLGVLPLFWWSDATSLVFASEIGALLHGLGQRPPIDRHGLAHYLSYRAVPAPRTLWEGIRKLPPGNALSVSPGACPRVERWDSEPPAPDPSISFGTAVERLGDALTDAVALAMVADVPVGAYLSGGIDSSLIAALAVEARAGGSPLHTYCATFGDPGTDETPWARQVAEHLGTVHVEVPVSPADFAGEWGRLSLLRGAPVSEPADIAVNRLAVRAGQDVKVVLSGEGSDELFAGYPKHAYAELTRKVGLLPQAARGPVLDGLARSLPGPGRRLSVMLRAMARPTEDERIRAWFASFTPAENARLLGETFAEQPLAAADDLPPLIRMLRHDQGAWLSDNLLERGDRMTMGASVELRPPFLNADVFDLARRLTPSVLRHDRRPKAVVKAMAQGKLPSAVVDRPKSGFRVPLNAWFRDGLRSTAHERLLDRDSFAAQHLDHGMVRSVLQRHDSGRSDESTRIWTLLSLEMWACAND